MTPPEVTLRDWFAGQALAGLLASSEHKANPNEWFACNAWGVADAVLAERKRRAEKEAKDAEEANRKAREWVKSAGLGVKCGRWSEVCVMDGDSALGTGRNLADAVAEAKAKLATDPAPLAPESQPAPRGASGGSGGSANGFSSHIGEAKPAPSTPKGEDDEAWARSRGMTWQVSFRGQYGFGATHTEAIRDLRAKVEGGAR